MHRPFTIHALQGTIDDPIVIKGKPSKEWRKALVALGVRLHADVLTSSASLG